MDHEREEQLRDLKIPIDTRKRLEDDEPFWFLHALASATRRMVCSYPQHDADGNTLEPSAFLDEVEKVIPGLRAGARRTSFRDVTPALEHAESRDELLAGLAVRLRTERDPAAQVTLAAAYAGCSHAYGHDSALARVFRRAGTREAALTDPFALAQIRERTRPFSASELQAYLDCPFLWFAAYALRVGPVVEEFGPLDRGHILHAVLEGLYRSCQRTVGEPVHLDHYPPEDLWTRVEADLCARLHAEPRFRNRPQFLRDIEQESLRRMMRRFLEEEIARAHSRAAHPAYFERRFGSGRQAPLRLGDGALALHGVIDRIDVADHDPTRAVVVDYKSSVGMSLRDLEAGNVLQAPIYALALHRVFNLTPLGAEFLGLKEGQGKGIYHEDARAVNGDTRGMRLLAEDAWQDYLARGEARLCAAAAHLHAGHISLAPTTDRCPAKCDYLPLCQGERFSLARQVRAAKTTRE
jgi:ATP-dependent helicase/DNAse subunit B